MQTGSLTGIVHASVSYLNSEVDLGKLVAAVGKL
jgi:hypothetical protein